MRVRDLNKVKMVPLSSSSAVIFKTAGQSFLGVYQGQRKSKYNGREVIIHSLLDKDGNPHDLWESTALNSLQLVKRGAVVKVTFKGLRKSQNSKRKYKDFTLEVEEGGVKKGAAV